jgi:hypothetical protein
MLRPLLARAALAAVLCVGCRTVENPQLGVTAALPSTTPSAPASSPPPEALAVGQSVKVRARHASGVPLHPAPESSSVSGRLADGSSARIERVGVGGRWFEVSQGELRGWVTRRYLTDSSQPPKLPPESVFASRDACEAALQRQERAARPPGQARIGSWNLHWFPDGRPGKGGASDDAERGSDLPWLACVITWLDLDALAVQEVKGGAAAQAALDRLRSLLDGYGGKWQAALDGCDKNGQHVGLLYDQKRVTRERSFDVAELNPHGAPCQDQLRPGHASYLRFPGGLDLYLVSAHFKAGGERRSLELRQRSFSALTRAYDAVQEHGKDGDVLLLGDLNTMGCPDCSPAQTSAVELAGVDRAVSALGFRRLGSAVACSHYFDGKGTLLDGALSAPNFAELGSKATVQVSGLCAELGCDPPSSRFAAQERLSDHCPVYVDIQDRDSD